MTGGDREGQSVEAREECEDAGPGTSIGRRGAAVDEGRGAPAEGRGTSGWSGGKSEHQTGGAPGSPGRIPTKGYIAPALAPSPPTPLHK